MFADAYDKTSKFTFPVIVSVRYRDGSVESSIGAFVVLNNEGWIATVAHLWDTFRAFQQHREAVGQYERAVAEITGDPRLTSKQKKKKLARLAPNPKWITNHSFWWGRDNATLEDVKVLPKSDLAIGRLRPFDPGEVAEYPVIKDSGKGLRPGTSLCRLGFPFYEVKATWDDATGSFKLPEGTLPLPRFPIEGIYTRNIVFPKAENDTYQAKFLETSSPGLRGQSGGPVFNVHGTVWAIQSRTSHYQLGFSPKVKKDGREVEENQFLNVGWGVHPETLVTFLYDNGVKFTLSDY